MNILIDAKKMINDSEKKQLISVKMIIIQNKKTIEYRGIFKDTIMNLKTGINFIENMKYDFVISIVILGKQIVKEKYSFIYKKDLKEIVIGRDISLRFIDGKKENNIKQIQNLTYETYKNYNFKINPLAIVRKETENKVTIFFNDNVYILKGNLMHIINKIYSNNEFKEDIYIYEKLKDINSLISKGCIICYE